MYKIPIHLIFRAPVMTDSCIKTYCKDVQKKNTDKEDVISQKFGVKAMQIEKKKRKQKITLHSLICV